MRRTFTPRSIQLTRSLIGASAIAIVALVSGASAGAAADAGSPRPAGEKVPASALIQPKELAALLAGPAAQRPLLLQVGFKILYRGGHIAGSRYVGPGSEPASIKALKGILRAHPAQRSVVLYCGCCPWADCPNVKPAYLAARESGRADVRVLYVARNLQKDWVEVGLPSAEGDR